MKEMRERYWVCPVCGARLWLNMPRGAQECVVTCSCGEQYCFAHRAADGQRLEPRPPAELVEIYYIDDDE